MILVSACLIGENCKYSGGNNKNEKVLSYLKDKKYITICPEVMGGLDTPRPPAEIIGNKVINTNGDDVTEYFTKGAKMALELAKKHNPSLIILKAKSPSCGAGEIYDGSFSGALINGNGVTAGLLINEGFKVITEKDLT